MVVSDKRQKRDFACTLDSLRKHSLVLGTGSGRTARKNLAAVGDKPAQQLDVLVVNKFDFVLPCSVLASTSLSDCATRWQKDQQETISVGLAARHVVRHLDNFWIHCDH